MHECGWHSKFQVRKNSKSFCNEVILPGKYDIRSRTMLLSLNKLASAGGGKFHHFMTYLHLKLRMISVRFRLSINFDRFMGDKTYGDGDDLLYILDLMFIKRNYLCILSLDCYKVLG